MTDPEYDAARLAADLLKQWNEEDVKCIGGNRCERIEVMAVFFLKMARKIYSAVKPQDTSLMGQVNEAMARMERDMKAGLSVKEALAQERARQENPKQEEER